MSFVFSIFVRINYCLWSGRLAIRNSIDSSCYYWGYFVCLFLILNFQCSSAALYFTLLLNNTLFRTVLRLKSLTFIRAVKSWKLFYTIIIMKVMASENYHYLLGFRLVSISVRLFELKNLTKMLRLYSTVSSLQSSVSCFKVWIPHCLVKCEKFLRRCGWWDDSWVFGKSWGNLYLTLICV